MKLRKILHRTAKFFGWKEDGWARLGGRWGKKRSYGHFAGRADTRTRAELLDAAARADAAQSELDMKLTRQELHNGQDN